MSGVRWPSAIAAEAPLERRGLAGIVDDERVDHRQAADAESREARGRQRHRLAGQPLGGAVGAELHQGVETLPQPQVERQIGMGRDALWIVVAGLPVRVAPAIGLEEDRDTAWHTWHHPELERAIDAGGIRLGLSPSRHEGGAGLLGKSIEPSGVRGQRHVEAAPGPR